jgi:riboflavin kinase/FMN adenylyltransferase
VTAPAVITIGNFDGVHLGHRAIVERARQLADQRAARVITLTFDPMPVAVLRPGQGPPHLGTIQQRIEALQHAGADEVVVLKPTQDLLSLDAHAFISQLIEKHRAVGFVEGEDFRFGRKRSGDMTVLSAMGEQHGFAVQSLERIEVPLSDQSVAPISSSLVRWLVGRGRVEDAAACLGRSFELVGTIVQGDQRGRTIGVPTANLDEQAWHGMITPMDGVYAGAVHLDGEHAPRPAAISVGVKPTFGRDRLNIEAHLIDYNTEQPDALYGRGARFRFDRWVRDQYPFPGVEALTQQLHRDIDICRSMAAEAPIGYD